MLDLLAFDLDLQSRGHVMRLALQIMFGFKLPRIRGLPPSFVEGHVKHGFEHVKLCFGTSLLTRDHVKPRQKLPRSGAIKLCTVPGITFILLILEILSKIRRP